MGSSARKKRERKKRNMGRGAPDLPASGPSEKNVLHVFEDKKGDRVALPAGRSVAARATGSHVAGPKPQSRQEAARARRTTAELMLEPSALAPAAIGSQVTAGLATSRKRKLKAAAAAAAAAAGDDQDAELEAKVLAAGTDDPRGTQDSKRPSLQTVVTRVLSQESRPKFGTTSALDLWGEPDARPAKRTRRRAPPSLAHGRVNALPAVAPPSHGDSYHPDKKAYEATLRQAVEQAEEQEAERLRLRKATRRKPFPFKLTATSANQRQVASDEEDSSNADGDAGRHTKTDQSTAEWQVGERKTKKQRAKEQAKKNAAKLRRHAWFLEQRRRDFERLPELAQEVDSTLQTRAAQRQAKKEEDARRQQTETRRVGPHKYQAPHPAVVLPEQLHGSLRKLEPPKLGAPSPLEAQFKGLQARNVIEPTQGQRHARRYRLRVYNKRGSQ